MLEATILDSHGHAESTIWALNDVVLRKLARLLTPTDDWRLAPLISEDAASASPQRRGG